jgi:hypothetical protein
MLRWQAQKATGRCGEQAIKPKIAMIPCRTDRRHGEVAEKRHKAFHCATHMNT